VIKIDEETKGCFAKAALDEPLFVLRANDELAPLVVELWCVLSKNAGLHRSNIEEAYGLAQQMREWKKRQGLA
jgi:hypothetical protein